jgi:hypothetical protein
VAGCFLGLLTTPASGLVWTGVVAAVLAEATGFGARGSAEGDHPVPPLLRAGRIGPVAALLVVGAVGLVKLFDTPGLLLVLLAVATCPAVLRPALRLVRTQVGSPPVLEMLEPTVPRPEPLLEAPRAPAAPSASFGDLATEELILAWRLSFTMLRKARTPADIAQIASRRRDYLDELERRNPSAVRRWLKAGARAASDPTRYFTNREGDSHRTASD